MQPFEGKIELPLKCKCCGVYTYVTVDKLDYNKWYWRGKGAREFFPYLTDGELHWMITGKCWKCASDTSGAK